MKPLVHVGMASHNAAEHIETAYADWLAQSYSNWRMTVSDNASTDQTRQILADKFRDSRVEVKLLDKNVGAYRNFERLRSYAGDAKYFCWSSDHDRHSIDFLEKGVEIMEQDERVILVASQFRKFANPNLIEVYHENVDTRHCLGPAERVRHILRNLNGNYCLYGLWRNRTLSNPLRIADIYGADYLITLLHALQGAYAYVDQPLLYPVHNRTERTDADSIPRIEAMNFLMHRSPMDHVLTAAIAIAQVAKHIAPDGSLNSDVCEFVNRRWGVEITL